MNQRQRTILHALERGYRYAEELAIVSQLPKASVRQSIQALRRQGFDIPFATGDGYVYTPWGRSLPSDVHAGEQ